MRVPSDIWAPPPSPPPLKNSSQPPDLTTLLFDYLANSSCILLQTFIFYVLINTITSNSIQYNFFLCHIESLFNRIQNVTQVSKVS